MAGRLTRGEIRLVRFPQPDKMRPVVVLTRDTVLGKLGNVTVAPITSAIRGALSDVLLTEEDGMKGPCVVNLHNMSTVPQERLGKLVGQLSPRRMSEICAAMRFSLGCDQD
jgi:mRNA interferase MazF